MNLGCSIAKALFFMGFIFLTLMCSIVVGLD